MTKTKRLSTILLGAILALGVGAGIGAGRVETGKAAPTVATMTAGENGSAATVNGKDAIKVGTSSKGGNMKITVGTGAVKLSFYAAAWNKVTGLSLNLTGATAGTTSFALTANTGIANNSPFTLSGDESSYYFETTLSGITSSTDITLTTSVAKRFVIWSASYDTEAGGGTVDPDPATSVNVTAAGGVTTVEAESTLQLSASVLPTTADQTVTWSSNNTGVATVNSTTGLVTGVAPGNVTITAASSTAGINGTISLTVIPAPPRTKVTFPNNGTDSGAAFTTVTMSTATNGLKDAINGDFITSTVSTNNVYPGATGFKYGSSSTPGKWRFTTAETVTKVEAVFKQYSSDTAQGKITSHESTEKTITSDNLTSETTLVLLGTSSKEFSVDVTGKRGYLISLHFSYAPAKVLESIEVTNQPSKNSYFVGDIFDGSGMVVKAHFDDDSSETITPVLPTTPLVEGQTSVEISYTFGGTTKTTTVPITVLANPVTSLVWSNPVTTFTEGATLTLGAGVITATYANSNTASLTLNDVIIFVYSGTFDAETATQITAATFLTIADHNGKNIRLGFESVYSNEAVLAITVAPFVPTTTYGGTIGTTATLVTDVANLAIGDKILISAVDGTETYVMSTTQNANNRGRTQATKSGNQITGVNASTMQVITLEAGNKPNTFALNVGNGYLYAASSSSNYLRTQENIDDNASFVITVTSAGVASATAQGTNSRNQLKYNSDKANGMIFSCYGSGQTAISIYEMNAGDSGLNYDYLLDVLAGDYCGFDIEGLDLINTRYEAMTSIEKFHFNSEEINGKDGGTYTGEEAYTAAMIRRSSLAALPLNNPFIDTFQQNEIVMIIVIISLIGVSVIGASLFVFKRKQNKNY